MLLRKKFIARCQAEWLPFPCRGIVNLPHHGQPGGLYYYLSKGITWEIFPPLIFLGVGALTDFGPLIANPGTMLLGAAAQLGIFITFLGASLLGFTSKQAASIAIIGGADGPTAIFMCNKLAPELMTPIVVAAYSYMSLVPLIQPPIMRLLTTKRERKIRMKSLRKRLSHAAQNEIINGVTIFLGTSIGITMTGERFLNVETLKIVFLGAIAFAASTAGGVLMEKLMNRLSPGNPINTLILIIKNDAGGQSSYSAAHVKLFKEM